jgi:hypothetical protein
MTYTEAEAISRDGFDKSLKQQVYDSVPLLAKLKMRKHVQVFGDGGGDKWTWPVRIAKFGKANAMDPRADITYVMKETRTQIYDVPRYYSVTGLIPWDKLRANKSDSQKVDLIADCTKEIKEDMDDRLATDLYTANPNGEGITPLTTIVDSTALYGGLAYNDASIDTGAWNAKEDSATAKLELWGGVYGTSTYQSLSSMVNACKFGQEGGVDLHLTTKDLASVFESILENQKVYQVNAKLSDKQMADAGFDNTLFKGAPVIGDPYCTAGLWLGLNTKALYLLYDPDYWMETTPWEKPSSAQQYAMKKNMCAVIQLKCDSRRTMFKFTALDAEQV